MSFNGNNEMLLGLFNKYILRWSLQEMRVYNAVFHTMIIIAEKWTKPYKRKCNVKTQLTSGELELD